MYHVRLDHTFYSKTPEIMKWLRDHVGVGDWDVLASENCKWTLYQMFGNTNIGFIESVARQAFVDEWQKYGPDEIHTYDSKS